MTKYVTNLTRFKISLVEKIFSLAKDYFQAKRGEFGMILLVDKSFQDDKNQVKAGKNIKES